MKIYHWAAGAVCLVLMAVGCHEAPIGDDFADKNYKAKGSLALATDVQVGFFDLADPDNAGIAFTVITEGETASEVEVTATHSDGSTVVYENVTSFPQTLDISLDDMQSAFGMTSDDAEVGDEVVFSFKAIASSGTYISSEPLTVAYSCASSLEGVYDIVTEPWCDPSDTYSGTSEWYEVSAGVYGIVDFAFGSYDICYGPGGSTPDGSLAVNDVCSAITITGASQWEEIYTWEIVSIDGAVMVLNWFNDYGEAGLTTLTRTDGTIWPPLTTN